MDQDSTLQQAISDLQVIRRAIERVQTAEPATMAEGALKIHLLLQLVGFTVALFFAVMEVVGGQPSTELLLLSANYSEVRALGVSQIAWAVLFSLVILYVTIYTGAKKESEDVSTFIARNFRYLRNLSFFSDLLIKYSVIALLILGRKPEWVAPVCSLFIGDYLIQGRFFVLGAGSALPLGMFCIAVGAFQFFSASALLLWPLCLFASSCLFSAFWLTAVIRRQSAKKAEG